LDKAVKNKKNVSFDYSYKKNKIDEYGLPSKNNGEDCPPSWYEDEDELNKKKLKKTI